MKKFVMSFAAVAAMLLVASCGNKSGNASASAEGSAEGEEAAAEVTYEQFKVEKYNVTLDIPKGVRRTDDGSRDNGAIWTVVPEDDDDFPIYGGLSVGVYESAFGDFDDAKIQKTFDEDIPQEATDKKLDKEKKEITYSVPGESVSEFNRILFKGNQQLTVTVNYSKRWESKLGGEIRDHILNSAKFN